jgi:hypothetical protein
MRRDRQWRGGDHPSQFFVPLTVTAGTTVVLEPEHGEPMFVVTIGH